MVDTSLMPITKRFQFFSTCRDRRSLTTCAESLVPTKFRAHSARHLVRSERRWTRGMSSDLRKVIQIQGSRHRGLCCGHKYPVDSTG